MPANQPLWLSAVHRLERAIGEPVESAVRIGHVLRRRDQDQRASRRKARGHRRRGLAARLHLLNLPAGTDIRRMREQLARMERRLNQLSDEVAEVDRETVGARGSG